MAMQAAEEHDLVGIVTAARASDPSIEDFGGMELARTCVQLLRRHPDADAAEIARRCVAEHPDVDASWASHIARVVAG